jgi:FkbM family methyltransferase
MITFHSFSDNGCKINFTYDGKPSKVKVKVLDGYTKLTFFNIFVDVYPNALLWVSTPQNVVHKIYEVYDEYESQLLLRVEDFDGHINLSNIDSRGYFKDVGLKCTTPHLLAIPLYEIFCNRIYSHFKCFVKTNDVVVDVGSNIGFFTYKSLYDGAKFVYSIEPNYKLSNTIASHKLQNVKVDTIALSNETHIENFYIGSDGISSCLETFDNTIKKQDSNYVRGNETFELTSVQTIDVMQYIFDNNISKIDFLKLDCEGSEYSIMDRIEESYLKFNVDRMVIEYHFLNMNEYKIMYDKMIKKIDRCGFKIEGNTNLSNYGLLFCWKESEL